MGNETIRIKRYPNRRLYDQNASRYVTLADIEQAVRSGKTVEIRDSQTDDDLTRSILTQIMIERHPEKLALVPPGLLHFMLRADDAMTELLRFYFQDSFSALERLPRQGPAAETLMQPMHWMQSWLGGFNRFEAPVENRSRDAAPSDAETPSAEESLRRKIERLERRVEELESTRSERADAQTGAKGTAEAGRSDSA